MRKAFVISAIIGIMVAGAATTTLAMPGDQYTLYAGGCLAGDIVNPPGSAFHCTEAISVNPNANGAALHVAGGVANVGHPSGPSGGNAISDQAAAGNLTSFLPVKGSCMPGYKLVTRNGKGMCELSGPPTNSSSGARSLPK